MKDTNSCIAEYKDIIDVELALKTLKKGGYNMKNVFLIGKHLHRTDVETKEKFEDPADRSKQAAAFWGSIFGIGVGLGMLAIPAVGAIWVTGTIAAAIFAAVDIAAISTVSGLIVGTFVKLGVEEDFIEKYAAAVESGNFVLVAHGSEDDVERANELLQITPTVMLNTHYTDIKVL